MLDGEFIGADDGAVLTRWAALLSEHAEELTVLLSAENGKPLGDSRAEVAYAIGFVDFFAAEARRTYGETIPAHRADDHPQVRSGDRGGAHRRAQTRRADAAVGLGDRRARRGGGRARGGVQHRDR